uniref:hypothetical protein n=1 Tax=Microbacterium sp. 18062 TaxID=2681410 RepID=UPI00135AD078
VCAGEATPASPPPRTPARVIAILTIVLGAALLLGAAFTGVVRTVSASAAGSESLSIDVDGVTRLDVDASAADLTIAFADVDEATLEIGEGRSGWRFERDGDTLRVATPNSGPFGFWFGGNGRASLLLPTDLEGADASLSLSAGSLRVGGSFADLSVDVSAGDLAVSGDARTLSADVSAGSADLRLADVAEAAFDLSAGGITAELSGRAPRDVRIDVSAGSLELVLPPGAYDVHSDVSAGDLDNRLERGDGGSGVVDVQLSAGDVTLLSGR